MYKGDFKETFPIYGKDVFRNPSELGAILPSHITGPKWPVKCLLIAARFKKEKNRPVQQGSPGALLLRRAQWRNSNAKRALLTEHQITGITF